MSLNGRNYDTLGDKEQALANLNNALKLANTLDDDEQLCRIYNSLFAIYYSLRDFEPVSDILNRALAIAKKAGNRKMICTLYNNMGLMAYEQGAYGKALQLMDQALNYATDDVKATASVLTNKAEVYYKTGDYAATDDILNRVIAMLHNTEPALIIQPYLNSALVKAQLKKKAEPQASATHYLQSSRQVSGAGAEQQLPATGRDTFCHRRQSGRPARRAPL